MTANDGDGQAPTHRLDLSHTTQNTKHKPNSPSAYFIARSLCDIIPLRLLPSLIFCGAIYPMVRCVRL